MKRFPTLLVLPFLLALIGIAGCSVAQTLTAPVDTAAAEAKVSELEQSLASLRAFIATQADNIAKLKAYITAQDANLVEARAAAEASKSEAALAVVAKLEALKATAESSLTHVQGLLDGAEKALPQVQAIVATAHTSLDTLKKGGDSVPLWVMLGTLVLPFIPKVASLIPGAGPVIGPIVGQVAETVWKALATSKQKEVDAATEAKAKALSYQIDVTHNILNALSDNVRNDAGVDDVISLEKSRQIAAGVHTTLLPLIAAKEITPGPAAG